MQVLISLGGPHQGVAHLRQCKELYESKNSNCSVLQSQANNIAYNKSV